MIWFLYCLLACSVLLGVYAFFMHLDDRRYEREVQALFRDLRNRRVLDESEDSRRRD